VIGLDLRMRDPGGDCDGDTGWRESVKELIGNGSKV